MRFAAAIWLYAVPLLPVLWLLLRATDRRAAGRLRLLLGARAGDHVEAANPRLRGWRRFLWLAGLFWLLLALARPQWGASEVAVTQRGSDIVVALDISNSMLAEDVPPNRLERAKAELGSFLERLRDSRVGLVFFAGSAFVQCPLTLDYGTADIFLRMAAPDMLSAQGTALGAALQTARGLLAKGREGRPGGTFQAILLVTDGEDLEGKWEEAARACQQDGIKLIPVGVGEPEGGLIPVTDGRGRPAGFLKDDEGSVVLTRLDLAALEKMAAISGGSPFRVGVDGLAGDRLFAELERLGKRDLQERRISAYQERYVWPLLLAAACFALLLVLGPRRPPVAAALALLLVLGLGGASPAAAALRPAGAAELAAGRQKYLQGDYEGALRDLESALVAAPEDPRISLAVGEALFRLERYEEAAREFQRTLSLTEDRQLRSEALYNAGTTLLAAGQTEDAAARLREALSLDPDPEDALLNLEAALRR
ncbi:MAG: VWA domain-containing protein, partial [Candidatus Krumholzibacteriia bacterium]